jgi:hypothetical protein
VKAGSTARGAGYPPLNVIHPHGAIDASGRCVMTHEEYRLLNGTLGLENAVHSCLEDNVLIVGMSLGDEYLRAQLEKFRRQIREIFWVRLQGDEQDPKVLGWAKANGVQIVVCDTPQEIWGMFSRFSDPRAVTDYGGVYMARVAERRQALVARSLAHEIDKIAHIAYDLSPLTRKALQGLGGPLPSVADAARLVWGSDQGEDPTRPGSLSEENKMRLSEIRGRIEAWAGQREKRERNYEARFND